MFDLEQFTPIAELRSRPAILGVYRARCAGFRGAVVVRKPVAGCRWVWVDGAKVRRCY
jgi:hypothetical protein